MWVFIPEGFFSVVNQNGMIHLRARSVTHLERLKASHPEWASGIDASESRIRIDEHADYIARMILKPESWGIIALELADAVDYDNFKTVAAQRNPDDEFWRDTLTRIWLAMRLYQMHILAVLERTRESRITTARKRRK